MNRLQRFITRIVPSSWATSLEAESRDWRLRCDDCGYETSLWEQGGVRWKATGNKRIWWRCPRCGARGWRTLFRGDGYGVTDDG